MGERDQREQRELLDRARRSAEQGRRLIDRLDDPTKRWKFNPSDLEDRARWDDYQQAYSDVLARCSAAAPWHVVPA